MHKNIPRHVLIMKISAKKKILKSVKRYIIQSNKANRTAISHQKVCKPEDSEAASSQ